MVNRFTWYLIGYRFYFDINWFSNEFESSERMSLAGIHSKKQEKRHKEKGG